ncbi:MAG: alkaline phosphatase family protein [Candidatus Omnitrophica bacterium]|nr:alkaline phosphatase family protein [Candidatus Omnitrophota bacterium]
MNTPKSDFDKKIIILGFDGLSPEIIEPMMQEGSLPNFSRLSRAGSYRRLATTNPSQSPVAWSGFSTGQNPGKNGMYDFIVRDPETYGLTLSLSHIKRGKAHRVIKSKCFWNYTSHAGIPTVIITCPVTFPPDKIKGRMLSGMGVPDILGTEGTFTFYTSEPLDKNKDIGGEVFRVDKRAFMTINIIGPRVARIGTKAENATVPMNVTIQNDKKSILIEYQNSKLNLTEGTWSNWQEVIFPIGLLKKAKGIFKFYLVSIEPEFKLYISPINFDPRNPLFTISSPNAYSKELVEAIGLYYTQGMPMDTWAVNEKRLSEEPFIEQVNEVFKEKKAMLDYELNRFQKGVLFCYFESSDIVQHMFWRYTDPDHPLYEKDAPEPFKEIIHTWYKKMDAVLGTVLEKMQGEDTLIVLSDHGFTTFRRAVHINSWLRQNGYLSLKNIRAAEGRELLSDIDWSKTRAYSIGFGALYINQLGRERDGIVASGEATELLKEELSQKLTTWFDEKYKQRVVNNVYKREEIFWGKHIDTTPDLYIGFNKGYRASWQTALGAVPKNIIEDNLKKWSGTHLCDPQLIPGIILSNKHIIKENPSILDITPTILRIIDMSDKDLKEKDFDGIPLF